MQDIIFSIFMGRQAPLITPDLQSSIFHPPSSFFGGALKVRTCSRTPCAESVSCATPNFAKMAAILLLGWKIAKNACLIHG
jgi:hypothetical protein